MIDTRRIARWRVLAAAVGLVVISTFAAAQTEPGGSQAVTIPTDALALEGLPNVRIDVTGHGVKRQTLDRQEAAAAALKIEVVDGRYYWTSRTRQPLTATTSGGFTYLMSTEPGMYVRFKKLNDRISYVEHVDKDLGSVTFWGELRIVVGR